MQTCSFVKTVCHFLTSCKPHKWTDCFYSEFTKGGIFITYNKLSQIDCDILLEHLRKAWGKSKKAMWWSTRSTTISDLTETAPIQTKALQNVSRSGSAMWQLWSNSSITHMFWNCPNISNIWSVFQLLFEVLKKKTLEQDPILAIIGVCSDKELAKGLRTVLETMVFLALRLILPNWKQKNPPHCSTLPTIGKYQIFTKKKTKKFY